MTPSATPALEAVEGLGFRAAIVENSGLLKWTYVSDRETLWFRVYRSQTENFADADEISIDFIPAPTSGTRAYEFEDADFSSNGTYYYWVEQVMGGTNNELHGPASLVVTQFETDAGKIYLPLVNN